MNWTRLYQKSSIVPCLPFMIYHSKWCPSNVFECVVEFLVDITDTDTWYCLYVWLFDKYKMTLMFVMMMIQRLRSRHKYWQVLISSSRTYIHIKYSLYAFIAQQLWYVCVCVDNLLHLQKQILTKKIQIKNEIYLKKYTIINLVVVIHTTKISSCVNLYEMNTFWFVLIF